MTPDGRRNRIAVAPPTVRRWLGDAVIGAGGELTEPARARAVVWASPDDPGGLAELLEGHPDLAWVQLPWAGIEPYVDVVRAHADRIWTCGKGVYAEPVAEHALALALAGMRNLHAYARARAWSEPAGTNLLGGEVVVVGGGGITRSLLRMLHPFSCRTTVVRRTPGPLDGADAVVPFASLDDVLPGADLVVIAAALTPETRGMLGRRRLELLGPRAWVVNVARGGHVVTDDLVGVLAEGRIGGAALDVTDPEPLPDGHPLWREPRCLISPHTANTPEMAVPLLAARVGENVRRWLAGEELLGPVDPAAGY